MTRRFAVAAGAYDADVVRIEGPLARRMANVLRLRPGEYVQLFDGSGIEARVLLESVRPAAVDARVVERVSGPPPPPADVRLYVAVAKGERFDWLVEKATELDVARIVPIVTARSVVKAEGGARLERWRRIAAEAAEQCGRGTVPAVAAPVRFADAIGAAEGALLMPYEAAGPGAPTVGRVIADITPRPGIVSVIVGPEGGFEPAEVERALAAGARVATLGRRILRVETAAIAALVLINDALAAPR
jgi:16S rRNA (uracil1498-N3)-methyltransferase